MPLLLELREELEAFKVLLRLCHDTRAFPSFNSFEHSITGVVEIAKQNEGWLKSQPGYELPGSHSTETIIGTKRIIQKGA